MQTGPSALPAVVGGVFPGCKFAAFPWCCKFSRWPPSQAYPMSVRGSQVLRIHGESNTGQASPRTPTQRTIQPQEAAQPQRNQTILQPDDGSQVPVCYTEKASPTRHRPEHQHNARSNRRKQCSPNGTGVVCPWVVVLVIRGHNCQRQK